MEKTQKLQKKEAQMAVHPRSFLQCTSTHSRPGHSRYSTVDRLRRVLRVDLDPMK